VAREAHAHKVRLQTQAVLQCRAAAREILLLVQSLQALAACGLCRARAKSSCRLDCCKPLADGPARPIGAKSCLRHCCQSVNCTTGSVWLYGVHVHKVRLQAQAVLQDTAAANRRCCQSVCHLLHWQRVALLNARAQPPAASPQAVLQDKAAVGKNCCQSAYVALAAMACEVHVDKVRLQAQAVLQDRAVRCTASHH
jgi:hypothetical protein